MDKVTIMNVSDFFQEKVPAFLLGAFFSRYEFKNNNQYIIAISHFNKSKKVPISSMAFNKFVKEYRDIINEESAPFSYWATRSEVKKYASNVKLPSQGKLFFILKNDENITIQKFYNRLYSNLFNDYEFILEDGLTEDKKKFIRGFMELRGSVDTGRAHLATDYFFHSKQELKKARLFVDQLDVPCYIVNVNFRELQEQFRTGVCERNPQFRLNLFWYMANIGIMNSYKAKVFAVSRKREKYIKEGNVYYFPMEDIGFREQNTLLDSRLNLYANRMLGKKLTDKEIKALREELKFDDKPKSVRDSELVNLFRFQEPDECMACKGKYNIEDRANINKKTGRYDLDVHHVISIGKDKELDDYDNLVKLCSTCHTTLKKGRGTPEKQKELIANIFENAPNTFEFAKVFFNLEDKDEIIQKTFEHLK